MNHPFECLERHRNVALPDTEKAADANDDGLHLTILIDEDLAYIPDVFVLLIVDVDPLEFRRSPKVSTILRDVANVARRLI